MKKFCVVIGVLIQVATASASLMSVYEFNGNFVDTLGNSGDLQEFNNTTSSFSNGEWTWTATSTPGGGLVMNVDSSLSTTYSIGLRMEFDETGAALEARKIIDFENKNADYGLYFYTNAIFFYNETANFGSVAPDTFMDLVITRSSSSVVTVYLDGNSTPLFSFADTGNKAVGIINGSFARFNFFHDDNNGPEWVSGGTVREIRVWNNALTSGDIPDAFAAIPEPATGSLTLGGLGMAGVLAWRRRHGR